MKLPFPSYYAQLMNATHSIFETERQSEDPSKVVDKSKDTIEFFIEFLKIIQQIFLPETEIVHFNYLKENRNKLDRGNVLMLIGRITRVVCIFIRDSESDEALQDTFIKLVREYIKTTMVLNRFDEFISFLFYDKDIVPENSVPNFIKTTIREYYCSH